MSEVQIRRQVDVGAWFAIAVGVIALVVPFVQVTLFDRVVDFNLLVLAIPIGFGLRTHRDGWRIAALGLAFLCLCLSVMSILLLVGNGGYAISGLHEPWRRDAAWGALTILGAASASSGWVAWLLTRARVLRLFGNA